MSSVKQFLELLRINMGTVAARPAPVLTIVVGIACAVAVLISMLAMGVGALQQAMGDVRPDRVVVLSTGARSATESDILAEAAAAVRDIPGIRKGPDGNPLALNETVVSIAVRRKDGGARTNIVLAGAGPGLIEVRPEIRVTAGRLFRRGLHELIANEVCARLYEGFANGDKLPIRGADWTVVGQFHLSHTGGQCTLYADAAAIMSALHRDSYSQTTVLLQSPAGYASFVAALRANPTLRLQARHESEVVAENSSQLIGLLNFAGYFIGGIMAIGATLGAVNSMYAIVDGRLRELAILRAIGFASSPIVASILVESSLLALPGALLGSAVAWLFFGQMSVSPFDVTFRLAVTLPLVVLGVMWALAIGVIGGLLPALRAANAPVTKALREA